jgi:hypothetical protein
MVLEWRHCESMCKTVTDHDPHMSCTAADGRISVLQVKSARDAYRSQGRKPYFRFRQSVHDRIGLSRRRLAGTWRCCDGESMAFSAVGRHVCTAELCVKWSGCLGVMNSSGSLVCGTRFPVNGQPALTPAVCPSATFPSYLRIHLLIKICLSLAFYGSDCAMDHTLFVNVESWQCM